ncbi:MAG: tetratricopeptide repeat protein [Cytophagales bacterium]|nr:tetratricopeptide repeat protein [Cytophagales bacterium]
MIFGNSFMLSPFKISLGIALLSILLYLPALQNQYNLDDDLVTRDHPLTRQGLSASYEIISSAYAHEKGISYGYRPLVLLSFALEQSLWGQDPRLSHLINILLYALGVFLFSYFFVQLLPVSSEFFIWAGLIFALHPLHTEVVLSLKNRDELIALAFVGGSACTSLWVLKKKNLSYLLIAILLAFLASLGKKSALPSLCVVPIGIILFRKDIPFQRILCAGLIPALCILIFSPLGSEKANILCVIFLFWILWFVHEPSSRTLVGLLYLMAGVYFLYPFLWPLGMGMAFLSLVLIFCFPSHRNLLYLLSCIYIVHTGYFFWNPYLIWISLLLIGWRATAPMPLSTRIVFIGSFIGIGVLWLYVYDFHRGKVLLFQALPVYLYAFTHYHLHPLLRKGIKISLWIGLPLSFYQLGFFNEFTPIVLIPCLHYLSNGPWKKHIKKYLIYLPSLGVLTSIIILFLSDPQSHAQNGIDEWLQFSSPTQGLRNEGRLLSPMENSLAAEHTQIERVGTSFYVMGVYAQKILFPFPLQSYYGHPSLPRLSLLDPSALFYFLGYMVLFFLCIAWWRQKPILCFGLLLYLITLFPYSNLFELVAGMLAERFTLYASWGFSLLCVGLLFQLPKRIFRPFLLFYLLFFTYVVELRISEWYNLSTLLGTDIRKRPSAKLHELYGHHLLSEGKREPAIEQFHSSLSLFPDFTPLWNRLGELYQEEQKYLQAISHYTKAWKLDPYYEPYILFNLGTCYAMTNQPQQAIHYYRKYLGKDPKHLQTYLNLSYLQFLLGKREKAKKTLYKALKYHPQHPDLINNLNLISEDLPKHAKKWAQKNKGK